MKSRDFCYWLQGYFELAGEQGLTPKQTEMIKKHLSMVFIHEIDPSFPAQQQSQLNQQHGGDTSGGWGSEPVARC